MKAMESIQEKRNIESKERAAANVAKAMLNKDDAKAKLEEDVAKP